MCGKGCYKFFRPQEGKVGWHSGEGCQWTNWGTPEIKSHEVYSDTGWQSLFFHDVLFKGEPVKKNRGATQKGIYYEWSNHVWRSDVKKWCDVLEKGMHRRNGEVCLTEDF